MKKCLCLLLVACSGFTFGCAKEPDPRERPGFVDTSDPSKVSGTMTPLPGQQKPGQGGGSMSAGAGAGPPPGGAGS